MPSKLIEKRNELKAKQDNLHEVLKQMGDTLDLSKVTVLTGTNEEKAAAIKNMNKEMADIGAECDALVVLEKAYTEDQARQKEAEEAALKGLPQPRKEGQESEIKDFGASVIAKKGWRDRGGVEIDIPLKTLMTTAAGFAPQSIRTGEVVPMVRRPTSVLDVIPFGRTTQAAIVYMEQTTRVNNAAEAAEGNVLGEAQLVYTQRTQTVENVGTWIPVTAQQIEDEAQIEGIINVELMSMLRERMDSQILVGTGATPALQGILTRVGVQSFAAAGDRFDACYDALKRIRVTGRSQPDHFIFHPNDWQQIRLARTDEGLYILGNPNEPVERLWGMQIVETDAETENTVLAGAFATWVKLYEKRGILVEITDSEADYFSHFKYAIRATTRVANVVTRPAAFCMITGF
jgi:HK97 family phage major capsid protein